MQNAAKTLTRQQLETLCSEQQNTILMLRRKISRLEGVADTKRRRWSTKDLGLITSMFAQGASVSDVALFFGVEMNAIYSICQRKGIRIRTLQHRARQNGQHDDVPLKLVSNA
ncbi:hypothetical protein [Alteromonas sp. BZK5]|uniref:hypothetical protein n=1 Tax=Alteromonas sp. BZK5 TaxID=1904459 RepID=UPI001653AF23|nr:hypothetical protein [Alteromonas sp. BZK5]MBC6987520.1 hypothetical protein [Alteromonas sp. BZK5]